MMHIVYYGWSKGVTNLNQQSRFHWRKKTHELTVLALAGQDSTVKVLHVLSVRPCKNGMNMAFFLKFVCS